MHANLELHAALNPVYSVVAAAWTSPTTRIFEPFYMTEPHGEETGLRVS